MYPHTIVLWILRAIATLHAVMALSQPFSIGSYLDGVIGGLSWHRGVGSSLLAVMMLLGPFAVLTVVLRGSFWHLLPPVALFVLETTQVVTGNSRLLLVHVPLGILIVLAAAWYALWLWRPTATQPRPRPTAPVALPQGSVR